MKKIASIAVIILVVAGGYFLLQNSFDFVSDEERTNEKALQEIVDFLSEEMQERLAEKRLEFADPKDFNPENEWAFLISFESIDGTIVLVNEDWMRDPVEYDAELTAIEEQVGVDGLEVARGWKEVIDSPELRNEMIVRIENEVFPNFAQRIEIFEAYNKNGDEDMVAITNDLIELTKLQTQVTQATLQAVKGGDLKKVLIGVIDGDRANLLISWHEERFQELLEVI